MGVRRNFCASVAFSWQEDKNKENNQDRDKYFLFIYSVQKFELKYCNLLV